MIHPAGTHLFHLLSIFSLTCGQWILMKTDATTIPADEMIRETKHLGVELSNPHSRESLKEGFQNFAQSPVVVVSKEEDDQKSKTSDLVTQTATDTGIEEIPDILKNLPFDRRPSEFVHEEHSRENPLTKHGNSGSKTHHLQEEEFKEYEWEGEESKESSHFGHFSSPSDEDHSEGEQEEYEWMEDPTRERVIPLGSLPPGIEKKNIALEQVETGLVYLLKTAHHNGLTARDIITHLQQRLQKSSTDPKHKYQEYLDSKPSNPSHLM